MNCNIVRVLIISTSRFDLDGITNVILNYYRALEKDDMKIDFVIPNELRCDLKEEFELCGSNVFRIDNRVRKPLSYIRKLSSIIKENKYDIVHVHGNSATLALEMYGAKKSGVDIRISHSHNTTSKHLLIHRLLKPIFKKFYTHGFACGEMAGRWLYGNEPFIVINNGIDISKYTYNEKVRKIYRNKYNLEGTKVIGHIGTFNEQKNHDFLIDIFTKLLESDNTYRLMLVGDGSLRRNIEEKVKELKLEGVVIFVGKTLNVNEFMQAMDMIIMPSLYEGFPLTLIEAQSSGLPCFIADSISKEVKITDLVKFISLQQSSEEWRDVVNSYKLIDRDNIKDNVCKAISKAGYNINDNAKLLKDIYKKYINEKYKMKL